MEVAAFHRVELSKPLAAVKEIAGMEARPRSWPVALPRLGSREYRKIPDGCPKALVCGYPILDVRKLVQCASNRGVQLWEISVVMQIADSRATWLARQLEAEG